MKRVFCKNCVFFSYTTLRDFCNHDSNLERVYSYKTTEITHKLSPINLNKDNDCPNYLEKCKEGILKQLILHPIRELTEDHILAMIASILVGAVFIYWLFRVRPL